MKSLKEIEEIRVGTFNSVDMRREHDGEVKSAGKVRGYVLCCGGTGCTSSGSAPHDPEDDRERTQSRMLGWYLRRTWSRYHSYREIY